MADNARALCVLRQRVTHSVIGFGRALESLTLCNRLR